MAASFQRHGDLPAPGTSTQQTGAIVADFANDGINGFVLSFRQKAPALVWYRRAANGWDRYIIESDFLTVEAGGVVCDVDGNGHPDIIFGGDWQSDEVWWWENPYPNFDPKVSWKRHLIKKGGATQHHDQAIGDFLGTGKPQLAFWNQGDKSIYLAEIPPDPRHANSWPLTKIFPAKPAKDITVPRITPKAWLCATLMETGRLICWRATCGSSIAAGKNSTPSKSAPSAGGLPSENSNPENILRLSSRPAMAPGRSVFTSVWATRKTAATGRAAICWSAT